MVILFIKLSQLYYTLNYNFKIFWVESLLTVDTFTSVYCLITHQRRPSSLILELMWPGSWHSTNVLHLFDLRADCSLFKPKTKKLYRPCAKHTLCWSSHGKAYLLQPPEELPQSPHLVLSGWSVDQGVIYVVHNVVHPLTSIFTARVRIHDPKRHPQEFVVTVQVSATNLCSDPSCIIHALKHVSWWYSQFCVM
ncbi:hypothetical protein PoB_006074800 [Plakobranchus ocellatus]|uniref:Dipeptidylpeptidase IV N-terminal domain-containing protein n=1 Tax=Plakobranchus ocellatus TaxID=259542 RepID=A0AAV4CQS7_9GAST|nr:hypothetical protein PoB_006074800 [Plakobranchus ocellatus]